MKRTIMYFIIFVFLFNCENRKKKGILPAAKLEDLMILYFFTGGASIMNNCDTRYKYKIVNFDQIITGKGQGNTFRIYGLIDGSQLVLKNDSSDTACEVYAILTPCDALNNEASFSEVYKQICTNIQTYTFSIYPSDKEKRCSFNSDLLSRYQSSIIFILGAVSPNGSTNCSFSGAITK
ncbi:MAG TPA: hypothetical protein PK453_24575 [Leptospiraceae bacterium]|nr:hypothetical protein [Leptospiraceae bacterium]